MTDETYRNEGSEEPMNTVVFIAKRVNGRWLIWSKA